MAADCEWGLSDHPRGALLRGPPSPPMTSAAADDLRLPGDRELHDLVPVDPTFPDVPLAFAGDTAK